MTQQVKGKYILVSLLIYKINNSFQLVTWQWDRLPIYLINKSTSNQQYFEIFIMNSLMKWNKTHFNFNSKWNVHLNMVFRMLFTYKNVACFSKDNLIMMKPENDYSYVKSSWIWVLCNSLLDRLNQMEKVDVDALKFIIYFTVSDT